MASLLLAPPVLVSSRQRHAAAKVADDRLGARKLLGPGCVLDDGARRMGACQNAPMLSGVPRPVGAS